MFIIGCYIPRNFMVYSGHLILLEHYSYFFYLYIIYIAFSDYDTESMLDKTSRPKFVQNLLQHHVMKTLYNDAFICLDYIVFIEMI